MRAGIAPLAYAAEKGVAADEAFANGSPQAGLSFAEGSGAGRAGLSSSTMAAVT